MKDFENTIQMWSIIIQNVVAYSHYEKAKDVENSIFDPLNRAWIC